MAYGIAGFSSSGQVGQPSPSIWGDCLNDELQEQGIGFYIYEPYTRAITLPNFPGSSSATTTFAYDATLPRVIDISYAPGTTTGNVSFWSEPLGIIAAGSGQGFWFEINWAPGNVTNTAAATFLGLTVEAGLENAFLATATSTAAVSNIGFLQGVGTNGNTLNLVQENGTNAAVILQANVTNSPSVVANGGTAANLTANTFVKLGLRYDGNQYLYSYVNGVQASKTLVDATFDQTNPYGFIYNTYSAATSVTNKVNFVRVAAKAF